MTMNVIKDVIQLIKNIIMTQAMKPAKLSHALQYCNKNRLNGPHKS